MVNVKYNYFRLHTLLTKSEALDEPLGGAKGLLEAVS